MIKPGCGLCDHDRSQNVDDDRRHCAILDWFPGQDQKTSPRFRTGSPRCPKCPIDEVAGASCSHPSAWVCAAPRPPERILGSFSGVSRETSPRLRTYVSVVEPVHLAAAAATVRRRAALAAWLLV